MKSIINFQTFTHFTMSVIAVFCFTPLLTAQTSVSNQPNADEQIIREMVAQQNEGKNVIKYTDDRIFVSGAYPIPMVGKEMRPDNQQAGEKIKAERKNQKNTSRIERLVVSQSGDMAYEFGYATLEWDKPDNSHFVGEASYLVVP